MKKYAIIVAGGEGKRMNHPVPKQFHLLAGKPVLYYSINAFLKCYQDMEVILVLPESKLSTGQEIIDTYFQNDRVSVTVGGRTRFHSVQQGLKMVEEDSVVMVHDAVRCLVTTELVERCYEAVLKFGSAIPVVDSSDSLRMVTDKESSALDRSAIKLVQTPQAFFSKVILPAFETDFNEKYTDEASVVEGYGIKVHLIPGEDENIKITRPADMIYAEMILAGRTVNQ